MLFKFKFAFLFVCFQMLLMQIKIFDWEFNAFLKKKK